MMNKFMIKNTRNYLAKRFYAAAAVKELPWCSNSHDKKLKKKEKWNKDATLNDSKTPSPINKDNTETISNIHKQYPKFGIIAAMDDERLIGIDNKLHYSVSQDVQRFQTITRDKILIIGKNTFLEQSQDHEYNFSHLSHLKHVIVISKSLQSPEAKPILQSFHQQMINKPYLKLVTSFEESLLMAQELSQRKYSNHEKFDSDDIVTHDLYCWVGGGQRVYEEAVRHPSATEIHLTLFHTISNYEGTLRSYFPAKYKWDRRFEELKSRREEIKDCESVGFPYTFQVYRRKNTLQ